MSIEIYMIIAIAAAGIIFRIASSLYYLSEPKKLSLDKLFGDEWNREINKEDPDKQTYSGNYQGKNIKIHHIKGDEDDPTSGDSFTTKIEVPAARSGAKLMIKRGMPLNSKEREMGYVQVFSGDEAFDKKWTVATNHPERCKGMVCEDVLSLLNSKEKEMHGGTIKADDEKVTYKYAGPLCHDSLSTHIKQMCDFVVSLTNHWEVDRAGH